MSGFPTRLNVLVVHRGDEGWPRALAAGLARWPLETHWTRSSVEAIDWAATRTLHVGVVGAELPDGHGLELVRRIRRIGQEFPCLLVCDMANPRLLQGALAVSVFCVVRAEEGRDVIGPQVLKVARQVYGLDWTSEPPLN